MWLLWFFLAGGLDVVTRKARIALVRKHMLAGFPAPGNEADAAVVEDGRVLELLGGEEFLAVRAQFETFDDPHIAGVIEAVVGDGGGLEASGLDDQCRAVPMRAGKALLGGGIVAFGLTAVEKQHTYHVVILELHNNELVTLEDLDRKGALHRIDDGWCLAGVFG